MYKYVSQEVESFIAQSLYISPHLSGHEICKGNRLSADLSRFTAYHRGRTIDVITALAGYVTGNDHHGGEFW